MSQGILEKFAQPHIQQAVHASVSTTAGSHTPRYLGADLPPALRESEREFWEKQWEKAHPPASPAPRVYPDQLGPFTGQIVFDGDMPVGGWFSATIFKNGNWAFSGHLHNSGFITEHDGCVFAVHNLGSGQTFTLTDQGTMGGTSGGGPRDHDWDLTGRNDDLAKSWDGFFTGGYNWHCSTECNSDFADLIKAVTEAVGAAAAIIALI